MPSYNISMLDIDNDKIMDCYIRAKKGIDYFDWKDLDLIFEVALNKRDRFPTINLTGDSNLQMYMNRWVKNYHDAVNSRPSRRSASPKSTCTDPAIRVIVQATQGMTDSAAYVGEKNHNLFMSAENVQGNLLEEYIATNVRPYGFLWCEGNVLRAIDFCNTDGTILLQIKNKSNTENSSSSSIRYGTDIQKWFRLGTSTKNGRKMPIYKWQTLNDIINSNKRQSDFRGKCDMNEDDYQSFLRHIAFANHNLITSL